MLSFDAIIAKDCKFRLFVVAVNVLMPKYGRKNCKINLFRIFNISEEKKNKNKQVNCRVSSPSIKISPSHSFASMAQQKLKKKEFTKKFKKFNKFRAPDAKRPKQNVKRHILEDEEIKNLQQAYQNMPNFRDIKTFDDFPLSSLTRRGLKDNKFKTPTEIQKQSLIPGLQGKDVLGAAITGSGK